MPDQLVVVITGAGRGIGNALARAYIGRPNCTVVGTIRDHTSSGVAQLEASPKGNGSRLILVKVESSSLTDARDAVEEMEAAGIDHIDILIPNAGTSPPVESLETVDLGVVASAFHVNALGPLSLYQACYALLRKSNDAKFMPITSAAGTISGMEQGHTFVAPSYCISKAALNWITLAAHCGNTWLTAVAINLGLAATDMGNKTAKYLGLEKAPWTAEQSAEKIMKLIDEADRDKCSGKFMDAISGQEFPW
ncbi:NAD(P)-binding protein [Hypoxylon rubiginosum]|uniref:NAD(P)-binding protein n=1 Tax=Hypoxylon rubiginosum TaxID=110542 RepID=A0ACC0CIV5_9PEZI|nr:NAD(P)-binding protein [Hypoxylon rubiginosum]